MKKILFIAFLIFVFLFIGETYSYKIEESDELKFYMLTLNSITNKNIDIIKKCSEKIVTIYPDNTFVDAQKYDINLVRNFKSFEQFYLNKTLSVSTTKYYEYKLNGIKIKKIKVVTSGANLKKCYNYLEKVEPL